MSSEESSIAKSLKEVVSEVCSDLVDRIDKIDRVISEIDYLLNDFQPGFTGKIRIEFLPVDGMIRPVPVVWRRSKSDNKWRYDKVGRKNLSKRVKRAREFADTWEIVEGLLARAMDLMEMRSRLIGAVTNMRMSVFQQIKKVDERCAEHLLQTRLLIMRREDGLYHTFITGHSPPRDV